MTSVTLSALGVFGIALILRIATSEALGLSNSLCRRLILRGVASLPHASQARWSEEWLNDLVAFRDRPLSALLFAIRTWHGASAVGREEEASQPCGDQEAGGADLRADTPWSDPVGAAMFIRELLARTRPVAAEWGDVVSAMQRQVADLPARTGAEIETAERRFNRVIERGRDHLSGWGDHRRRLQGSGIDWSRQPAARIWRHYAEPTLDEVHERASYDDAAFDRLVGEVARMIANEVERRDRLWNLSRQTLEQIHAIASGAAEEALRSYEEHVRRFGRDGRDLETHLRLHVELKTERWFRGWVVAEPMRDRLADAPASAA